MGNVDRVSLATLDAMPARDSIDAYDRALRHAYWNDKDIAVTRAIARAGIRRAMMLADEVDGSIAADEFRGAAKTMAYNLASFTWPGWNEPGITLAPADVADGADAARLNFRLGLLLGKPDRVMADAWWLIGAHAIAAGDLGAATEAFAEARSFAASGSEPAHVAMLEGYTILVEMLLDRSAIERFESAVTMLRSEHPRSAYAEQLIAARKVFAPT